ncbi:MAG: type IX secretion system sortase PorU [Bacteroidota bacterium]|nr:type IX secretion system sortase PorU [Bacteroidota bacterium]
MKNLLFFILITSYAISSNAADKSTSVLATGNWYKIAVQKDGLYKLSYSNLLELGVNTSNLSCSAIRILGNGGGMLPHLNSDFRHDGLQENAILVVDNNANGIFESNDYVLFYGQSPDRWSYNESDNRFHHQKNLFSRKTYYFITTDLAGGGKRVQTEDEANFDVIVNEFDDFSFHEQELENFIKSGAEWYGEKFDLTNSYTFNFSFPNFVQSTAVYIKTAVAARSFSPSSFTVKANSSSIQSISVAQVDQHYTADFAKLSSKSTTFTGATNLNIEVSYNPSQNSSIGWLNYIELNARRQLKMNGSQMLFRDTESLTDNVNAKFTISNTTSNLKVWDVTDPINVEERNTTYISSQSSFIASVDSLKEYVAFNGTSYYSAELIGEIANQNLYGFGAEVEYVIVSHPDFLSDANELATYHEQKDGINSIVVTPQQIYNEFSSGAQDITAIRDFLRYLYKKPNSQLKYLLLFGDASYDPLNRISNNSNFVPSYQSNNSVSPTQSYVTDDYFGLMDDAEGNFTNDLVDIGIGRFPVQTLSEANDMVQKVKNYNGKRAFGDWRNRVTFIADDGDATDGNTHMWQADSLANIIDNKYNNINLQKIYLDAFMQESTPGGPRCPDAQQAITEAVEKGTLLINYSGHGGELGWTKERILEVGQINKWENANNLPLFVTATCEFSRFDDPERVSAGEYTFLNRDGGAIALLSTSRLVYASPNYALNKQFVKILFEKENGQLPRLGDLFWRTKVNSGTNLNNRNFTLLGDPALCLSYPELEISTTAISDTISALGEVSISGQIEDENGNLLSNFNGLVFPIVYDKAETLTTLGQESSTPMPYKSQHRILYKGKASVQDGIFSFSFVVPKDIAYNFGSGRISYYAISEDSLTDASGYDESFTIGGTATNIFADTEGPEIELFLNNARFVSGGVTNEDPLLFALLNDFSGINTVGNGIGHDIVAILDEQTNQSISLNEYYSADTDNYQSGKLTYPFYDLSKGHHTLRLKVWDVFNNSSEKIIDFYVTDANEFTLSELTNYPNPFINSTAFYFQHNRAGELLNIELQILNLSGKMVASIKENRFDDGYRIGPINWDGTSNYGEKLGPGIYIYRLNVTSEEGTSQTKAEKLIILR